MRYRPLTATPITHDSGYQEIEPCRMLQPYVRCFWGGEQDDPETEPGEFSQIVIPDTCVDIIYVINDLGNIIHSDFAGLNDKAILRPKSQQAGHKVFIFAIRFYAWSAYIFSEDSFFETVNGIYDVRERFSWLDKELRGPLSEPRDLAEMIRLTESLLLKRLETAKCNKTVDGIMIDILRNQGSLEVNQLSKEHFISSRQMERLFHEYIGITPKKLSNLVRYQNLWRDIVSQTSFNMMDAVLRYGYTDLPHLMREFKHFHTMNIRDARKLAFMEEIPKSC